MLKSKVSRTRFVITMYLLAFGVIVLLICLVGPEQVQNLYLFTESADQYLLDAQAALNGLTDPFTTVFY